MNKSHESSGDDTEHLSPMADYPAAHSMDTSWFAVDADGHVAQFGTGEAGSAPNSAFADRDFEDMLTTLQIIEALPAGSDVEYYVDDLIAMPGDVVFNYSWSTRQFEAASFSDGDSFYASLLWLSDESLLGEPQPIQPSLLSRMLGGQPATPPALTRVPNSKHILAFADAPLSVAMLQSWVRQGVVRRAWVNHDLPAWRLGIFDYSHGSAFENWISGPYMREGVPIRPLRVSDLPESLRPVFESTRFTKSRFARDIAIDPREAGPCSGWENSWVDLNGLVHRDADNPVDVDEVAE